jgi:hypothetical protein
MMLSRNLFAATTIAVLLCGSAAQAAETPLYVPTPDWVTLARLPDPAGIGATGPAVLIFDVQQRITKGALWNYVDTAQRITSPEQLNQLANLTLPWAPDKGDLHVHELAIVRNGEQIK